MDGTKVGSPVQNAAVVAEALGRVEGKVDALAERQRLTDVDIAVIKAKLDRPGPNWTAIVGAATSAATLLIFVTNYGLPIGK